MSKICICLETFRNIVSWALSGKKMPIAVIKEMPKFAIKRLGLELTSHGHLLETKIRGKRPPLRRFSPKQLAAQRLFAKRARAGTLRGRRKRRSRSLRR